MVFPGFQTALVKVAETQCRLIVVPDQNRLGWWAGSGFLFTTVTVF